MTGLQLKLTDLGHDILRNVCAEIFEDHPRERVTLSWQGESRMESEQPCIFPGPPAQILLDLAPMHSELAAATRPYIWREVLVAYCSYDQTEQGMSRLERAQQPHIAPHVRALYLSFNFLGDQDDYFPQMVSMINGFTSLRAVCLGTFQSHSQPSMKQYAPVSAAIRDHPSIDTLVIWHMTRATDVIAQGASRPYRIQLEYCHEGTAALLSKPEQITSLYLQNMEFQNLAKRMPAGIWESLKHLSVGYPGIDKDADHRHMQKSLQAYIDSGRTPALQALDLSDVSSYHPGRQVWLKLARRLPHLYSFTYASRSTISMKEAKTMLKGLSRIRRLHFVAPSDEDEDDEEEFEEVILDPDFVDILAKLPLERLILNVFVPNWAFDEDGDEPADLGRTAAVDLAERCATLETVQLRYMWEDMDSEDEPVIVEYNIKRTVDEDPTVEVKEPRLLEGTILEFLDWR
ncbi:hypothetical protein DFH06DRAFT_1200408 [Mycena polygramma]|nr:hypothetical protein DFH06DRAFT_1200408 [Mycena polygramma]